jgi:hypothetical protein
METLGDGRCINEITTTNFTDYVAIQSTQFDFPFHIEEY